MPNTQTATKFENTTSRAARVTETAKTTLQFSNAVNAPASNAPGIGVTVPYLNLPAMPAIGGPPDSRWSLLDQGFKKASLPEVRLFNPKSAANFCTLYQKDCALGETVTIGKWAVPLFVP